MHRQDEWTPHFHDGLMPNTVFWQVNKKIVFIGVKLISGYQKTWMEDIDKYPVSTCYGGVAIHGQWQFPVFLHYVWKNQFLVMWGKMGHPAKIEKSRLNCINIFGIFDHNWNKVDFYSICLIRFYFCYFRQILATYNTTKTIF